MGEAPDQIVAEIAETRVALDRDLGALERHVQREVSLRVQYQRRPWLFIGAAILLGFLVVRIVRR